MKVLQSYTRDIVSVTHKAELPFKDNMMDVYRRRFEETQFHVLEKRLRHIPVKRMAPCPTTSSISAQPKRSRMFYTPVRTSKPLSVRPANLQSPNSSIPLKAWGNHPVPDGGLNGLVSFPTTSELHKSVSLNHMRSSVSDRPSPGTITSSNSNGKARCCPLRSSAVGYATPPYCAKPPKREVIQARRKTNSDHFKSQGLGASRSCNAGGNLGCLQGVKSAAQDTIKAARNCMRNNDATVGENVVSTHHAYLRRREQAVRTTKDSEGETASTALVSSSNGSVKTTESSQRYSNNFNPQMTSTPQRSRHTATSTTSSAEFKKPFLPKSIRHQDLYDMSIALSIFEEERQQRNDRPASVAQELEAIIRDLEDGLKSESDDSTSIASSVNVNNNNNYAKVDPALKLKTSHFKLPSMYPIGAPKAASSPVMANAKFLRSGSKTHQFRRRRHYAENNSSRLSNHPARAPTGLWRPW